MSEEILTDNDTANDEVVLEDSQLICLLTGVKKSSKGKEGLLQSVIRMLNEEYGFDLWNMERDFSITGYDPDSGKNKKQKLDLAIFEKDMPHEQKHIIRVCSVQDEKTKENDKKKGVEVLLQNALSAIDNCEFGLWTNGSTYNFLQKEIDAFDNFQFADLSDFPGEGQTIADLDRSDKSIARNPANDSLIRVFKRCHDYIYGNEGMKKTAFWELLNLIFCKIYDEKRRFIHSETGESYRREFWVGVKEQNTNEGRAQVAKRIKGIFDRLKQDQLFSEVFDGNEQINLTDKGLAFISGELAKYSFLDASVDVKGLAYETIVSNTLKQEAGQFFTPRNIVKCMVEMMDPNEHQRVLDPACGSGGFLVMVLDYVRRKITKQLFPDLEGPWLEDKFNSFEVNHLVKEYAGQYLFGFDFDPDLKKAARMNMVMAGDGHANIFHANSLAYPKADNEAELKKINEAVSNSIANSTDYNFPFEQDYNALGKFDLIFTNPPFGAKIPINDPDILSQYDLGHNWKKDINGQWQKVSLSSSEPPEILFIDQCYQFLKPGGKMAIVLPDGILGNPNTEYVRAWILERFKLLASIDLAVEAFLPQVGVQASLLFLQKKTEEERTHALLQEEDYDVFMAIAEKLGKDRRGNQIYQRDEDGGELLFDEVKAYLSFDKTEGKILKERKEKVKHLDDDLPKIAAAYQIFVNHQRA
ncbi:MAG: N-6 DNA methylase [Pyrinomonadaceae bacterium]|nr:N-6 DNA methylase [Sphingobacteriaceae bacterium]